MTTAILTCRSWHNSSLVANTFYVPIFDIRMPINWAFDDYLLVFGNRGDEELPLEMEDFLLNLKIRQQRYRICELGNYFGYERPFGAATVAVRCLQQLQWELIAPIVSLDTVPKIDWKALNVLR